MSIEQMKKEIELNNAKRLAVKAANSVECDAPEASRSYTYRTCVAIKANNIGSL